MGAPLSRSTVYRGIVTHVSPDAVTVSGTPWTANEFKGSHLIHFLTGSQEGRFLEIVSHTAAMMTLRVSGTPLTQPGYAVVAGDEFEIAPCETLDTLFGASKEDLTLLPGSSTTADLVGLFIEGAWVDYFFDSEAGKWLPVDSSNVPTELPIVPGTPLRITRRGPDKKLLVFGEVPTSAASLQLQGAETPFGWPFPVDQPLKNLQVKGPAVWERSGIAEGADWIVENEGDQAFFQLPGGSWVKASGGATAGEFKLPTGGGFSLVKKTWPVALKFHSLLLPYSVTAGSPPAKAPGSQSISFQLAREKEFTTAAIPLGARASSGLPVAFSVSGPARISGGFLYLAGLGQVTVTARQIGNDEHSRAADVVSRVSIVDSLAPVVSKVPSSMRTDKSSLRIYGSARDNYRLKFLRYRVKEPGGRMGSFRKVSVGSNPGAPKTFSLSLSTGARGSYEVQLQVVDAAGNRSSLEKIKVTKK